MKAVFSILAVVVPIFAAVIMGMLAKRKQWFTPEQNQGLQQYVMKVGLPCVLFNSCLTADLGAEALTSMCLLLPLMACSCLWAFRWGRKRFPYHNLPMLFTAQETGMMGISLFAMLFGAENAYRIGMLDMSQSLLAIPIISLLAADTGKNPSPRYIVKQVITSPLLLMGLLGLTLNLSGAAAYLDAVGIGQVLTQTTAFLAQPVTAVILFSVGYNFSLDAEFRKPIFRICGIHTILMLLFCGIIQAALFLVPNTAPETRWAVLMYFTLPGSFIAPGLGRTEEESSVASGVCSVLTLFSLLAFCVIAIAVS